MKDYGMASSILTDDKTMVSWKIFVENVINNFNNDGFDISHISQMNIIIVCSKVDMTYGFYMKHNMHAVEWKLNQLINKDINLKNKRPASWIYPLNRKFEKYLV